MSIPGLDLCPTYEDDLLESFIELKSFNGIVKIPKSQINGACRSVTDFQKIIPLKITSTWIMRKCFDPRRKEIVCVMKYKDSKDTKDTMENDLVILWREIEILNLLKHDNIIQFYEPAVGEVLNNVHLVFEFSHYFLSDLIYKNVTGLYQKPMIKNIMHQLLQAIEYLHDKLIMHRDISTTNIMFNDDGFLKLANFHNARKLNSSDLEIYVTEDNHLAPEIILKDKKHHGCAVDIWASACLFSELILKRKLFAGDSEQSILENIVNILGPPKNLIWNDCDGLPGVEKFIIRSDKSYNYLKRLMKKSNLSTNNSINLIKNMLVYDPARRFTASHCLQHPYFTESPVAYTEEKVSELLELSNMIRRPGAARMC